MKAILFYILHILRLRYRRRGRLTPPCMVILVSLFAVSHPVQSAECLDLEGIHVFCPGDNPSWSSPDVDDNDWQNVQVPGDLSTQGLRTKKGMGWYRIRFFADNTPRDAEFALAMGNVGNADEVYLNGVKIGGEGKVGDRFVEAPWKERLYRIPNGLLRIGEENILAVRIMDTYCMAGIYEGPVRIGDYGDMVVHKLRREFARKGIEIAFFTLFFFFLMGAAFLFVQGVRTPEYASFILFLCLYGLMFALESLFYYDTGLKTPLVQRLIFADVCLLPAAGLYFLVCLYRDPVALWLKTTMAASVTLAVMFLCFPSYAAYTRLLHLWLALFVCSGAAVLFLAVRACMKRRHESGPILVGIIGFIAGICLELIDFSGSWPVSPSDLGMVFFLSSAVCALMVRYARIGRLVRQLSGRILEAQEEERKRLSRNIHDTLGQSLMAIKLQLQMIGARQISDDEAKRFKDLVSEVDRAVVDLRHIAMDLRPSYLEESSMAQLFTLYGRLFTERTGIPVHVRGEEPPVVPIRIKDNLYRVYQEALTNISKHAAAQQVEVSFGKKKNRLTLAIRDNGKGFDPVRQMDEGRGIGLLSMKERAELLGGLFRIQSLPGRGCTVFVEALIK